MRRRRGGGFWLVTCVYNSVGQMREGLSSSSPDATNHVHATVFHFALYFQMTLFPCAIFSLVYLWLAMSKRFLMFAWLQDLSQRFPSGFGLVETSASS